MNNILIDVITDTNNVRNKILPEFHGYFDSMINPASFTVNFHPKIRRRINGRWSDVLLDSSDIEKFWDYFSGELSHLNYYSYERKMARTKVMAFANVDYGKITKLFHIHGVIDNRYEIEPRVFQYCIHTAFKIANNYTKIKSGDAHLNLRVDDGWVNYVFKDSRYCYPLIAK